MVDVLKEGLCEGDRWELIGGVAYQMSAPTRRHQALVGLVYVPVANFLEGKPCKVYVSPFDSVPRRTASI